MSLCLPMPEAEELNFRMRANNLLCAVKRPLHFGQQSMEQKRRERLVNFSCSIGRIFRYEKWLISGGEYAFLNEREKILQRYCNKIIGILFERRNDLKNMKIRGNMANSSTFLSKAGDDEKAREWLDSFEFKI